MEKKKRKIVALRHTEALPDGSLTPGAVRFVKCVAPVIAAIGLFFNRVLVSTSARARKTAELLLDDLGIVATIEESAVLDPPPDEVKKGVPGATRIMDGIRTYRETHPGAGVATAIIGSPGGEEYMRRKAEAVLGLLSRLDGDVLIVAHENGVTALALAALGQGYGVRILHDFRFVEGVCFTIDDGGQITDLGIIYNPAFNS